MFTLEERTREWERRHPRYAKRATPENEARYAAMCERVAELAQLAEESANAELEAFGCVEWETALSDAEWNETSGEFWEFACDLYDEPRGYVLTELF